MKKIIGTRWFKKKEGKFPGKIGTRWLKKEGKFPGKIGTRWFRKRR